MKTFQNPRLFAAATLLFAVATLFNATADDSPAAGKGRLLIPVEDRTPVDVKLNPTVPLRTWEEGAKQS